MHHSRTPKLRNVQCGDALVLLRADAPNHSQDARALWFQMKSGSSFAIACIQCAISKQHIEARFVNLASEDYFTTVRLGTRHKRKA